MNTYFNTLPTADEFDDTVVHDDETSFNISSLFDDDFRAYEDFIAGEALRNLKPEKDIEAIDEFEKDFEVPQIDEESLNELQEREIDAINVMFIPLGFAKSNIIKELARMKLDIINFTDVINNVALRVNDSKPNDEYCDMNQFREDIIMGAYESFLDYYSRGTIIIVDITSVTFYKVAVVVVSMLKEKYGDKLQCYFIQGDLYELLKQALLNALMVPAIGKFMIEITIVGRLLYRRAGTNRNRAIPTNKKEIAQNVDTKLKKYMIRKDDATVLVDFLCYSFHISSPDEEAHIKYLTPFNNLCTILDIDDATPQKIHSVFSKVDSFYL